tara:strand:+ start:9143 stop:9988 length:846 start_codon:yes stop_codon:yes gene_type:complete
VSIRIIPRLDIKGPNLVKGIQLEGLRVLGKPSEFAQFYYENGADEILYMDVVASLYEKNNLSDLIKEMASEIFIPLTVGGGIRKLEDINEVLRSGADKILINTAAVKNPAFIGEAIKEFGSSTIVVAIEAIKEASDQYLIYTDNGREYTGIDAVEWAKEVESLGAGEIVITSVNREGTGEGFDINLIKIISENINIPLIAHGGAGAKDDVLQLAKENTVEGISIASLFHYEYINKEEYSYSNEQEGNTDFLQKRTINKNLAPINIKNLKSFLIENGIEIRS